MRRRRCPQHAAPACRRLDRAQDPVVGRPGDVRHFFPDIELAQWFIGYCPSRSLTEGMEELVDGFHCQVVMDKGDAAMAGLERFGLLRQAWAVLRSTLLIDN
jgi:hypothetical protein